MSTKLPLDSNYDLEQQFILRMTDPVAAANLAADIAAGVSFRENFTIEFKPDMRHTVVRYNGQVYQGRLMDLPCIIESLKTTDKKTFYKTADICQMMICTQGEDTGPLRGTAAYLDNRAGSHTTAFDTSRDSREFQFLHGLTPPLKNVLRRRFRKCRRKRLVDMPKIEKEVKQLLRADLEATNGVKWEVIWSDPPNVGTSRSNQPDDLQTDEENRGLHSGALATADDELEEDEEATRVFAVDRRDVFGDLSSSSVASMDSSNLSDEDAAELDGKPSGDATTADHEPTNIGRPVRVEQSPTDQSPKRISSAFESRNKSSTGLGSLKDELAAELLLSDSGDSDAGMSGTATTKTRSDMIDVHSLDPTEFDFDATARVDEEDLEGHLQASVAAQLVAHASVHDDNVAQTVGHDVDVDEVDGVAEDDGCADDDDDDDDDVLHPGGELLDDAALMELTTTNNVAPDEAYPILEDSDAHS
ncbi:Transcription initiation factor TFIID subunit 7 [Fasciola gigantica]|uniref:Transcription initiation factor TFIID subunit 7 n=1 Tax=Fasciola gigantica TaxID=46835 RepID=A0A504YLA8_FASGI|nr:Transcription initiation factor TFIID subunit 7 [Fasciola gigantica]